MERRITMSKLQYSVSEISGNCKNRFRGGIIVVYTVENAERQTGTVPNLSGLTISEANRTAVNAGFNIKVAGATQGANQVISYKQSVPAGNTAQLGTVITVYFRSSENVTD